MKTPYFKKTTDSAGNEWVDSQDIFQYTDEFGPFSTSGIRSLSRNANN